MGSSQSDLADGHPVYQPRAVHFRPRTYLQQGLPRASDQAPLDECSVERILLTVCQAMKPHDQASDCETLPRRRSRPTAKSPDNRHQRPQLRAKIEGTQRLNTLRIHLQTIDNRSRKVHTESDASIAGIKQVRCIHTVQVPPHPLKPIIPRKPPRCHPSHPSPCAQPFPQINLGPCPPRRVFPRQARRQRKRRGI